MRRNATRTSNATSLGARPLVEFPKSTSRPSNFGQATPKTARKTLDFACRFFHELGFSVGSSDRPSKNHNFKKFFDRSLSDHLRQVLPGLRGSEPETPAERIKPVDLQKPISLTGGPYLQTYRIKKSNHETAPKISSFFRSDAWTIRIGP